MLRRPPLRPLLAVAAASLALAGCGTTFPGDAVVVGDSRLSLSQLDTLADAGCTYLATAATSQGSQVPSQGQVRQVIVTQELQLAGARSLAEERGIAVPRTQWALGADDLAQLETMFGDHADDVQEILERDFESQALRTAIGADETGTAPTQANAEQLMQAGTTAVTEELRRVDASVDPRFGLDAEGQPDAALSLSASREQLDQVDPSTLPSNQQCRGVESSE
ncbi:hypothetical protein [Mumia sp. DW29H23]|uniref:hypothetical protein n=1 Tax=Mumia sp. DW29H23 TaxID=3421241 RepID=UPI003D6841B6